MSKRTFDPSDTQYLQRLGSRWYARVPVPNALRPRLGPYLRRTLETSDLREAQRRRWDVVTWARGRFREEAPAPEVEGYAAFLSRLKAAGPVEDVNVLTGEPMMNPTIDAVIDEVEAYRGPDKAERVEALQDFIAGRETVSAILASYLEANPKRSPTTAANYRKAVDLWIEKHGDRPLRGVTRRKALEWLEEVGKGKARDTVQRYATVLSHLVDWDCRMDETPPLNPFKDIVKGLGKKHNGGRETYHPFTGDELKAVFKALDGRDDLKAAAMVSLFSGLRLSEVFKVVRMKVDGVDCYVLPDGQGKTDNAARVIPVHPRLADVVIPEGLKASAASVAFGRKLDSLKLGDGKVFHSLRKNFAGALEHMHCPELTAVRLLGHSPISISYRVYSKHRDAAALREWVEKVSFKLD